MWDKIKAWFKHSLTILWARIVALGGVIVAALVNVAGDPNVNAAIQAAFQPKYLPWWLLGIGLVTELARRRTVSKPTTADNKVVG